MIWLLALTIDYENAALPTQFIMQEEQNNDSVSPMQPPHAVVKDAPAPFDDGDADVILRSCDLVDFRVFKLVLSFASPVFKSMFTLPQSPSSTRTIVADDDDQKHGLPVVRLSEDARTLQDILRACYPGTSPHITCIEDIARVLAASEKYEMEAFRVTAREMLINRHKAHPVSAYIIALRFEFEGIITDAAVASLEREHTAILGYSSTLLELITAEQFRRLLSFHHRACEAASEVALSQDWLKTLPPQMMSTTYSCPQCREKRTVADTADGKRPTLFFAPPYLWEYLNQAARKSRNLPSAKASSFVMSTTMVEPGNCDSCKFYKSGGMTVVRKCLADAITEAVSKVRSSASQFTLLFTHSRAQN